MRRLAPRPLAAALGRVVAGLEPATLLARVQGCWVDAVGDVVSSEAQPVGEREGVVTVSCRSSVWAEELKMLAPELCEKVNAALGEHAVTELKFRATGARPRL
jgi:predicted nucleic acid-binding Zn ribbon protein